MTTIRKAAMKLGIAAIPLGLLVSIGGACFGNSAMPGFGCALLFGSLYFLIFSQHGSF